MPFQTELFKRRTVRAAKICGWLALGSTLYFQFGLGGPLMAAVGAGVLCSVLAFVYLVINNLLVLYFEVNSQFSYALVGGIFSLVFFFLWCCFFPKDFSVTNAALWLTGGVAVTLIRHQKRVVVKSDFQNH